MFLSIPMQCCDLAVFKDGFIVLTAPRVSSKEIDGWVKKVAMLSGQRVSWHFLGQNIAVKAIGDLDAVESAMNELWGEYDALAS